MGKGLGWAGKSGKAKGQGKSLELMEVRTPINNNLLPWYGCTRPNCPGKWCYGNNPPDFCGICWVPCGKTRPLAGKGEPMAPGVYQKGQAKGGAKNTGGGKGDKGGGKDKDNRIARPDGNVIGKGTGEDNNEDTNKDKDDEQKEAYNKEATLVFLNQLVANGSKELADSVSLNTGIFIPIARPKVVEKDLYTNYVQASNHAKKLKNDLESQLGKLKRISEQMIVSEAKCYELRNELTATDEEVNRLQALHIASLLKVPEPAFEIPQSQLDVLGLNLNQAIEQIKTAKASLPGDAAASYSIYADGMEGIVLNMFQMMSSMMNKADNLQEDLNDPLNTIPENIQVDLDEDELDDDVFDDDVYETIEEKRDASLQSIWMKRTNKGRMKRAASETTTIDEASEILENCTGLRSRTAKIRSTSTGEAAPTESANS